MKKAKAAMAVFAAGTILLCSGCIWADQNKTDPGRPVISMDSEKIFASIHDPEERLLQGVTAWDEKDGDVTSTLAVEHLSNFVAENCRKVSIVAFDSENHVTHAERELEYTDYTPPVFSLDGPLRFSVNANDLTEGLHVEDCLDGDLTERIQISYEEPVSSTPGLYALTYTASNHAGDAANLPVTVELYDPEEEKMRPSITLSRYLLYLDRGEAFDPEKWVEQVRSGISKEVLSKDHLSIENPVDVRTPGVYEVVYTAADEEGMTGSVRLVVWVRE